VALGAWGGFRKRIVTTLVAMTGLGVAVAAVGLTPASSFLWALVSMSCVGLIAPLVNGPVYAILQATIAPDYQGRVFSLVASLAGAAAPLGLIMAAPVAELVGVGVWYLAAGIACVAMGITGFFAPALVGIEEGAAEAVASMPGDAYCAGDVHAKEEPPAVPFEAATPESASRTGNLQRGYV
jgi:DHA3 family macrolide efflux protein-like MFS transporter